MAEETMRVKSNLGTNPDGSAQTAFWEKDPAHPDGEVFVAGDGVVTVGRTGAVLGAIGDKRLVEVQGGEATTSGSTDPRATREKELAAMNKGELVAAAGADGNDTMTKAELTEVILNREFPQ